MKPDWSLGRGAGHVRNTQMAEYANAAIIFWDGESNGSRQLIGKCKRLGLDYRVVNYQS